jgi:hypothetical protein
LLPLPSVLIKSSVPATKTLFNLKYVEILYTMACHIKPYHNKRRVGTTRSGF